MVALHVLRSSTEGPTFSARRLGSHAFRRLGWYAYLLPVTLLLAAVYAYPFVSAIWLSFWQRNLLYPLDDRFVGLANYTRLLSQETAFRQVLANSVIFTVGSVVFEYLLGLGSALLLASRRIRFRNLFRSIVLLPYVVPIAVNSLVWKFMLSPSYGPVNRILSQLGLERVRHVNWLGEPGLALGTVVFVNVWRSFPLYTIVLLAALSSIPVEEYEAAAIDGASRWQSFRYVTLPGIKDVSVLIVLLHLIWTFANFDVIYLLTKGGPLQSTEVLPTFLYRQAFEYFDMGYAAAVGVTILVILSFTVGAYFTRGATRGLGMGGMR